MGTVSGDTIEKKKSKMVHKIVLISCLLVIPSISLETEKTNPKAASPYTNCGCQCSSLTFRDKSGRVQGNCKSADHTGAQWCYVDTSVPSTCQDLSYTSVRFPGKPWSYEACATPACGYNNGGFNNGGYNNGGYNNGGYNNGGFSNGGYDNGGFDNGGFDNGGFSNGGNGGFNNGGFNNGGFNNGGFSNGGLNNGGHNNGGFSNGGYGVGSSTCRGTKCFGSSGSSGLNNGAYGSSSSGSGTGFLAGILGGRSQAKDDDSVKFGRRK